MVPGGSTYRITKLPDGAYHLAVYRNVGEIPLADFATVDEARQYAAHLYQLSHTTPDRPTTDSV